MASFSIWTLVGIALLIWVGWDLFAGYTYLHRVVVRTEEPGLYWVTMAVWTIIAVWCLGLFYQFTS